MVDQVNSITALRDDYRQRRDLANFYQGQITALDTASVQAWSTMAKFVQELQLLCYSVALSDLNG